MSRSILIALIDRLRKALEKTAKIGKKKGAKPYSFKLCSSFQNMLSKLINVPDSKVLVKKCDGTRINLEIVFEISHCS